MLRNVFSMYNCGCLTLNCLLTSKNYRHVHTLILNRIHQHSCCDFMEKTAISISPLHFCMWLWMWMHRHLHTWTQSHSHALRLAIKITNYIFICCNVIKWGFFVPNFTYLNMNINRMSSEKNIATLSIVLCYDDLFFMKNKQNKMENNENEA